MNTKTLSFNGKSVIITGAGHPAGIGRACARAFASQGAQVVVTDLAGAEGLDSVESEMHELGGSGLVVTCDVTIESDIRSVLESARSAFGGVDVLVNSAGVGVGSPDFLELSGRDWELSLNVNLRAVAEFCRQTIPIMRKGGGGAIVNIASLAGLGAITAMPACYTASKFAVVGLTKQIAVQFAAENIRCNAVCPGSVRTRMFDIAMAGLAKQERISVAEAEQLEASTIPLGYAAEAHDIAEAVLFLSSGAAKYVTGIAMPVAGGMAPGL